MEAAVTHSAGVYKGNSQSIVDLPAKGTDDRFFGLLECSKLRSNRLGLRLAAARLAQRQYARIHLNAPTLYSADVAADQ